MDYTVVKSRRKTAGIQIKPGGEIIVRVPSWYTEKMVRELVDKHQSWIVRKLDEQRACVEENKVRLTVEERDIAISRAKKVFPERTAHYAEIMGVTYGRITIREQKTRWGSCSSKGNLNFNWKLVLAPDYVLDYVVVHELAHRRVMNHSKQFYAYVAQAMPDYQRARVWLREHGASII